MKEILAKLYLASQVDLLSLSLINLLEMIKDGEIDLVLEQDRKSLKQKALFIQKIIDGVESPELREALDDELNKDLQETIKTGNEEHGLDFFREKNIAEVLRQLQAEAEQFAIVRLTVATEFKEKDLKDMAKYLEGKLDQRVALHITVDSSLIGGAIVQSGNYISDYSLKTRLDQFRSHWHRAVVEK